MFIELIELLRCPQPHDETQLVASSTRSEARHLVDGLLGCPVCGAEFVVANGVAEFGLPTEPTPPAQSDPELALRLAALLDLTGGRGIALLCGIWAAQLDAMRHITDTPLVAVNPPPEMAREAAAVIRTGETLPFASGCARGAALVSQLPALSRDCVRVVRPGGRLVAAPAMPVPPDAIELARDDRLWVAQKPSAPALVQLRGKGAD